MMRVRILLVVVGLLCSVGSAFAQVTPVTPSQFVAWDQSDYTNVTRFEIRVDSGAWADVGKPAATGTLNTVQVQMPAMTPGAHALTVRACNVAGCSAATAPLNVTLVVVPTTPGIPRIVPP
jgi:hypothetical protein